MLSNVYITNTSAFLPNAPVSNDAMEAVLGMVGETPSRVRKMILRSNGIQHRYYAIDPITRQATHSSTELAVQAVKKLGNSATSATCLAVGTSYPDQIMPGQGVMVHGLLDAEPMEVLTTAGVCVAGMAAMKHAYNAVRIGEHRAAIATASETASAIMRSEHFRAEIDHKKLDDARPEIGFEKDFLRWMLSDGAGAVLLANQPNEKGLSLKIHWIDLVSYANEMPVCMYAGAVTLLTDNYTGWKAMSEAQRAECSAMAVKQDVKLLNENIVKYTVEKALERIIPKYKLNAEEIDYFLPHYSSGSFRDKLLEGLQRINFLIPQEKWFTNLTTKGNTGSASIYIMLDEFIRTHDLKQGQKILCYVPESGRFSSCFMLLEAVVNS
ncbi:3-oxoacyl-ACP synthase [Mannheimia haemolytica MhBrain2012]|uniref:beta-ketoacyl-ACP synthase III n=1 Tax=Mannheimia haemolytica TaxID=75985 RepID=UPI0003856792|nr:beta-ketoacyl-ACP synthase III [Mannheimia haemolytica]EPZ28402.1 3-oxoacyl-ACP synthase [Mannheimia haemolytica MhBrain2012]